MALLALGRASEAKAQFEEDLKFFQERKNEYLCAKILYNLGEAEYALKNFAATTAHYQRCVELSKAQKNYEMLLRAYNGLGNVHHLRRDYEASLHNYERALAIAQKTGDVLSQAGIEINLGTILNLTNRPAKAVPHLRMVRALLPGAKAAGAQEKYFLANAALEWGDVARRLLKYSEAQEHLDQAKALAGSEPSLARLLFPIRVTEAKLLFDQGRGEEAKTLLAELEKTAKQEEEKIELAKLANFLASAPLPPAREPAVTEGALEYGRPLEAATHSSFAGEGAYAKLLELTRFLNAETNLDFVLKAVMQYALELSGAERGLILLLDKNDRLEIKTSVNAAAQPHLTEISTRIAEQALLTGEPVETDDATQDQRFNEYQSVMILKLRSVLCLPIRSRNKTVGVLYLDHRYRPGAFGGARLPLLQAFCDQAGIALENAKLFAQFEAVQAELKQRLETARDEAEHYHELLGENTGRPPTRYAYDNIVAKSRAMHEVFKVLDKITATNISVFIQGETGTGKELIAKALHYNHPDRAKGRFVAINCGGIPANLIESELFGYKAGAFTGATRDKKGLFVEAHGGTLFLDEVADLDVALQVKLLRALEEGEVVPVGDTRPVRFDVRVVSASHKKLENLIREGKFREDLYYRVCQIRVSLPALRERPEDIPLLIEKFASDYAQEHDWKKPPKISAALLKRLVEYDWPGNVRELENTIRVACALADKGELTAKNLPDNFGVRLASAEGRREGPAARAAAERSSESGSSEVQIDAHNLYDPRLTWEDYEKRICAKAYAAADFKPLAAAELLDVSAATFYKRIKDFDLANRGNPLFEDPFVLVSGKTLRSLLEEIFRAAYQASGEKAYTAIKWLDVSQGHFYNVLKAAKKRLA
jgi:transcriptional regulator with GAF, ATPase, and Fis domain